VEEHAHKASALLMFADIEKTSHAVTALATSPVAAVELIDRAGLRSVQDKPGMPDYMASLSDDVAALLVEVRATTEHELEGQKTHLMRPRLLGYAFMLLVMMGAFVYAIASRVPFELDIARDRGSLY
ncbi:FAD-linked oxidase C-terminal domain-containing protein, partial [Wenyingzhuangia sp. 1_MG-2023]|nr:FAD-linked oxidase C-terminal domain-containing protein [Wenyingzhuangia sp. 1_MG-2023]